MTLLAAFTHEGILCNWFQTDFCGSVMIYRKIEQALVITKQIVYYFNSNLSLEVSSEMENVGQKQTLVWVLRDHSACWIHIDCRWEMTLTLQFSLANERVHKNKSDESEQRNQGGILAVSCLSIQMHKYFHKNMSQLELWNWSLWFDIQNVKKALLCLRFVAYICSTSFGFPFWMKKIDCWNLLI